MQKNNFQKGKEISFNIYQHLSTNLNLSTNWLLKHFWMLQLCFLFRPYIMTQKEQNGLPRSILHIIFWLHGMQVCHILRLTNCSSYEMCTMPWAMAKIFKCFWQILNLNFPRSKGVGTKSKDQQWV